MSNNDQKRIAITERRGLPVYETNPSVPDADSIKRKKPVRFGDDKRGFVLDGGSGEVLSVGGAGFYEFEEVDDTRFVKLYLAGVKQATGLSKAGLTVFELVYRKIQDAPNTDTVLLNSGDADMTPVTYRRGVRELLEKEFLYLSKYPGLFFVNIRFMFNGDRLAFVKGYKRKPSKPTIPSPQQDLFATDKPGE